MKSKKHTRVACKREGFDVGWEFDWKRFLVSFFFIRAFTFGTC
jgi:hypothetical protein